MFLIQHIIVGVPLTEELTAAMAKVPATDGVDNEYFGFEELYHGSATYPPGYCGVQVGDSLDLLGDALPIAEYQRTPTAEQIIEAGELLCTMKERLPQELHEYIPEFGVWVVESTS